MIDETEGMSSSSVYRTRFGSLIRAHRLAGYFPERNYEYIAINQQLRSAHSRLVNDLIQDLETMGASIQRSEESGLNVAPLAI